MKKFAKLFLLVLCSGLLSLGFSNAQNLVEEDLYTNEYNTNQDIKYMPDYSYPIKCTCDSFIIVVFKLFLTLIGIALGILLIIITINAVTLHKKFKDTQKDTYLSYIPILNLYSISKVTIGKVRFFCLILLLGFFGYSVYKNINRDNGCCPNPSWQDYTGIIVGIVAIIILSALISKLSTYFKESSNKELTKK